LEFHILARYLLEQGEVYISSHFSLKILVMFTKLNPEPTDKWSVLKSDKLNYSVIPIATHYIRRNSPSEMDSLF